MTDCFMAILFPVFSIHMYLLASIDETRSRVLVQQYTLVAEMCLHKEFSKLA